MRLPIMTMIEMKDMAAMEGLNDKLEALAVNLLASQTDIESGMQKRGEIRQVLRMKVVRDGILRKRAWHNYRCLAKPFVASAPDAAQRSVCGASTLKYPISALLLECV